MGLQDHGAEFQGRVPLVLQPRIALHAKVVALLVLAVFGRIRKSEILYLFGERGPVVSPIMAGACHRSGQHAQIGVKLDLHHVDVSGLEHRPIHQALVLCRHGAATPTAVVGCIGGLLVYIHRVEGEQRTVELGRPLAVGIAAEHVAEQGVVAGDG